VRAPDHAPQAVICIDPFHAVSLVTDALDVVRRAVWNELRQLPDQAQAKAFKGARWALLKRPENLNDEQSATLRRLRARGGAVWRGYALKEAFRAIFAGDLDAPTVATMLDRWCSKASRSRLDPFVKVAKTIRKFRDGILAAVNLGINNARAEGLIIWSPSRGVADVADGADRVRQRHVIWSMSLTRTGWIWLSLLAFPRPGRCQRVRRGHVPDATVQVTPRFLPRAPDNHQRPPRTPPRLGPRLPQPHQLHRQIIAGNRRIQTPTTPSTVKSHLAIRNDRSTWYRSWYAAVTWGPVIVAAGMLVT